VASKTWTPKAMLPLLQLRFGKPWRP